MKIQVLKQSGSKDSKIDFPQNMLVKNYNFDLVHQFISTFIHNSHQNTKGQKNRSAVRGGGRKPWRQKGTGRARSGTIRSPIWRSGGVTFAHVYKPSKMKKVNKKMYRAAMRSIFSRLVKEERLIIVADLLISKPPKTSEVKKLLSNLKLSSAVFVLPEKDTNLVKASRNLHQVQVQTLYSMDPTTLIKAEKVIFTPKTLEVLAEVLSK
tara:strand:- start:4766 stop:5392 length:627 start_codon:yes stop_codon:yes gene_type:complete